jgi:hypothetical protein
MRVSAAASTKAHYIDRIHSNVTMKYSAGSVAPHVITTRISYTVPSNYRAYIESLYTSVRRDGTPTIADYSIATILYTPDGGNSATLVSGYIRSANIGDRESQVLTQSGVMLPGDMLTGITVDNSTGGTCTYVLSAKVMQYIP